MNDIKKGTIIRTVVLFVALINQVLVVSGYSPLPFNNEEVELFVSTLFTGVISIITWWNNQSFSKSAIKADETIKKNK